MDVITVGLAFIGYYYKSFGCCLAGIIVGSIGYIGVTRTSNNMFSKILYIGGIFTSVIGMLR